MALCSVPPSHSGGVQGWSAAAQHRDSGTPSELSMMSLRLATCAVTSPPSTALRGNACAGLVVSLSAGVLPRVRSQAHGRADHASAAGKLAGVRTCVILSAASSKSTPLARNTTGPLERGGTDGLALCFGMWLAAPTQPGQRLWGRLMQNDSEC